MKKNEMEAAIFGGLIIVQFVAHYGHCVTGLACFKHLGKYHWVVWIAHPAVLHGLQDYAIHVVDVAAHTFIH